MNRKLITRLLTLVFALVLSGVCSTAHAQSDVPKTDTVYHDCFGCDSFLLTANNTVYYSDTVVTISQLLPYHGTIYESVRDIYIITVGHSVDVRDTAQVRVCRDSLPYAYHRNFYTQSGDYWVDFPSMRGCDSAHTLLQIQVLEGQRDTIQLSLCYNQSYVVYDGIPFDAPGYYRFPQGKDADGCPIEKIFHVIQYPLLIDSLEVTLCSNKLPYQYKGRSFDSAGVYTIPYTVEETGCQAVTYLTLNVNPSTAYTRVIMDTVCASELPYDFMGQLCYESKTYYHFLKNVYGCDSMMIRLELEVVNPHIDTVTLTLCVNDFPYAYDSVHTFTAPGKYFLNDSADENSCSSFRMLQINTYPSVFDTLTICTADSSYTFGDTTFTVSTVYTYTDTNSYNCLDYHTISVNLNQQMAYDTTRVELCESQKPYHYYEQNCYASGFYAEVLQNKAGCDSITKVLHLVFKPNPERVETAMITRNGLPYMFRGKAYMETGVYRDTATAATAEECDTTYILVLTVKPIYQTVIDTTVCDNVPVVFFGDTIVTAGAHQFVFHLDGYDSVITVNVHHNPTYRAETMYVEVGEYELPYYFVDSAYYTAGYHEQILSTINGCDSVLSVFLTINPAVVNSDTITKVICSNELPLVLFDSTLTQAGVYRYIVPASTPAVDSVFFVNLVVKESPTLILADTMYLCAGGTLTLQAQSTGSVYLWNNGSTESSITVTLAGLYSVTVSNAFECSTSANVQVIGVELPDARILGNTTVCEGSNLMLIATGGTEYLWNDGSQSDTLVVSPSENTTYMVTVTNAYGCSRAKDVAVTVNPLPELTIFGDNSVCYGESTTFTAYGATLYHWNTGSHQNHITVNTEGVYTVTATDDNGCVNTQSVTLTVHPLPVLKINGRTTFCPGSSTKITATGAAQYEWSSGEVSQSIMASLSGNYTVTGTDQYGCQATKSVNITQSSVNASISGNRYFCHGESTTLTVSGDNTNTYQWYDGSSNKSIVISNAGQYSVTVTNAMSCQNTLIATVTEYNTTAPSITGVLTICEGQSTTLRANGGNSYVWDDGSTQPIITVNHTGTYSVTATDNNGCTSSTSATVLVNPAPNVTVLAQDAICKGDNVSITAISTAGSYQWTTGQNTATINVSPNNSTTYTVCVTDENGCFSTASTLVTVKQLPSAYINGKNNACQGDTVTLLVSGGVAYHWNTGQDTPILKVTNSGDYSVEVTAANGCTASSQTNVTFNPLPIATVTESAEICRGQQATLMTDAPAGCTYEWSTGSHQSNITVNEPGEYRVTVTNANQCSQSYQSTVIVHELPQVTISGNTEICEGQNATLMASGDNITGYLWSNGDNNAITTVNAQGLYSVVATNAYNCTATASRAVTVHALPELNITGNLVICEGNSTTLTVSGGVTYVWNTGATGSQLTVNPATTQSYSVTATNSFGCMASKSATVTVNTIPQVVFSGNTTICNGASTTISALGASTYLWSTGAQTSAISVNEEGYYRVTITNAQNCMNSDSIFVKVNPIPQVLISGNDHVCAGSVTTLTATGAVSYVWNTQETTPTISVSPTNTTTYTVTGYDTNNCSKTVSKVVNVEALPVLQILGERTICQGQSSVLTATGGTSYLWNNGSTSQDIAVFPMNTTSYTVTAYNDFGCSAIGTAVVNVNMLPSIFFNGVTSICEGQSTTITATGGSSYVWNTGASGNYITVSLPGIYKVTVTNALNCTRSDSIQVVVWNNPVVNINGADLICEGTTTALTASGANTYAWSTGESGSTITVMPEQTTTYSVIGYDANGCSATVSKVVNVESTPEVVISGELTICHGQSTTLTASDAAAYLWSTGATSNAITVSNQGVYAVTASSLNGCQGVASVMVVDNPVPSFTVHGLNTLCENTTANIYVTGNNAYEWSTGSTDTVITISDGGVYTVTATNSYGCQLSSSVNVTLLNAPILSIIGVDELCQGDSTLLVAASDVQQYLWSTGETTPMVTVTPNNSVYSVTVTGANGCSSELQHQITSLPTYHQTLSASICEGQSYTGYGFDIPVMDTAGLYMFTRPLQTVNGCDSIVDLKLTVNPLPRLDTINGPQNITQHGNAYFSVNNPQYVNNYEWRVSNPHWTLSNPNYSNVTLNVETNGTGTIFVRGINGCGYKEISLELYCNVGIEDHPTQTMMKLYPNPVHQSLYIDMDETADVAKVALFDEAGRLVYQTSCNDTHIEIDCSRFANGHYTVQFFNEKGRRVESRKIVVKNK